VTRRVGRGRLEHGRDELGLDCDQRGGGDHDDARSGALPFGLSASRVAGKQVTVGDEGIDQVGGQSSSNTIETPRVSRTAARPLPHMAIKEAGSRYTGSPPLRRRPTPALTGVWSPQ